jgi:hypothetical protein
VHETLKELGFILFFLLFASFSKAQPPNYILKPPQFTIDFGSGDARDPNSVELPNYERISYSCPGDGFYSITSYTSECFHDDWHTLTKDHTGNAYGNMLLVNVAPRGGMFLKTPVSGLKSNTMYEIALWLINLCKPTKKCPTILLPNLNVRLETPDGKIIAGFVTGDLQRVPEPRWGMHHAYFTTPAATSTLMLVMSDNVPGGCGNDFALDDITFRECVKQTTQLTASPKPVTKKETTLSMPPPPKKVRTPKPSKTKGAATIIPDADVTAKPSEIVKESHKITPSTPSVLKTRENPLVKDIETEAGEIRVDVYDNGEIDGDSVSIYHNNALIKSHMRLSDKPISFTISINPSQPHHEIIMVAENLGSIPPNTSLMIVTTPGKRYEVFISSDEQRNAKVVFDLKK